MAKNFTIEKLPPKCDLETKAIYQQLIKANRHLAELKGISKTIPNQSILINTLPLLEAKDSSAIENIITTHDEIYKEALFKNISSDPAVKEVQYYSKAIIYSFEKIKESKIVDHKLIVDINSILMNERQDYRQLPGTELRNLKTGKTVYVPPQDEKEIKDLMENLIDYVNYDKLSAIDPLVKMAVMHYQFESIHPFYDGNGRTGRILNILYLVKKGLLDIPILYMSRYIIKNKSEYYYYLQNIREKNEWEEWILFMLKGVEETSIQTIRLVQNIRDLMQEYKTKIRKRYSFYSQELLNNIFRHPYTKIEFIEKDLNIHRQTASSYLKKLTEDGFLELAKFGKHNFYINRPLFELFKKESF